MPRLPQVSIKPTWPARRRRAALTALTATAAGLAALATPALGAPAGWGPLERIGGATDSTVETPLAAMNAQDDAIVAWSSPERQRDGRFRDLVEVRHRVGQRGAWSLPAGIGVGTVGALAISREYGRLVVTVTARGEVSGARSVGSGKWTTARIGHFGGDPVRAATILEDGTALVVIESRGPDFTNPGDATFSSVSIHVQPRPSDKWVLLRDPLFVPPPGLDAVSVNARGDALLLADFADKGQANLTPLSATRWRPWVDVPEWSPVAPADLATVFPGANPRAFLPRVSDLTLDDRGRSAFALTVFPSAARRETRVLVSLSATEWARRLTLPGAARIATSQAGHLIAAGLGLGAAAGRSGVGASPVFLPHAVTGLLVADPLTTITDSRALEDGSPTSPLHLTVTESGRAVSLWHTETGPGPDGIAGSARLGSAWEPVTQLGSSRDTTQLVAGGHSALALIDESEEGGGLAVRRYDVLPRANVVTLRRERGRLVLRFTLTRRAEVTGTVTSPALGRPIRIAAKSLAAGKRRIDLGRRLAGVYRLRMSLCVKAEGCAPVRRIQNAR